MVLSITLRKTSVRISCFFVLGTITDWNIFGTGSLFFYDIFPDALRYIGYFYVNFGCVGCYFLSLWTLIGILSPIIEAL